ncbi:YwiC-like family protein [Actinokineospora enzanensis]|uniref:YwiC-like family protein n=1 Tax=Actinokineospora enzanensis TaxID=155975 RepID=UPI00037E5FE7|nr:phosphatase PAP2 family protein [Actinokineospora enzanensis]
MTAPNRLARVVTEVFSPAVVVLVLPLAVAWAATGHDWARTLLWGLEVALFSSILPMLFIIRGARAGRWDGHHVRDREHRFLPLAVGLGSTAVGITILVVADAPHDVLALALAMFATLAVCVAITRAWKISIHGAVAGGAVAMVTLRYGPWSLLLIAIVALVCWSRVTLGDHTPTQVIAGALTGPLVGGTVFLLVP